MKNDYKYIIKLRPHHINCIFFYKGLGYDEKFTKHMNNLVSNLKSNPYDNKIKLILNCDDVCSKCPNKLNDKCNSEDHIKILDKNTIDNYNISINSFYSFNEIINKIYLNFDITKFQKICSSCEWYKHGTCSKDIIEKQINSWNI